MAANKGKKVTIVEPDRSCLKPDLVAFRDYFGKKINLKTLYGHDVSIYGKKGSRICPSEMPYLRYNDGLYCCMPTPPTDEEAYLFLNFLSQNIESHAPTEEHRKHWKKWAGLPQTKQQAEDIAASISNPRRRNYSKDMRWLKGQYAPGGPIRVVQKSVNADMAKLVGKVACETLRKSHCEDRRDCLYDSQTERCTKKSEAAIKSEKQRRQIQERQLRELRQWSQRVDDEMALQALLLQQGRQSAAL
jgi:hypothetical protein